MSSPKSPVGQEILDSITDVMSKPYPDGNRIPSSMEIGMWLVSLELLEARLLLANAMTGNRWLSGPKVAGYQSASKNDNEGEITPGDVLQARLLIDTYIVNFASRPYEKQDRFPFRELLERLVRFKSELARDPIFSVTYGKVANALRDRVSGGLPPLSSVPEDAHRRRIWYKIHVFYRVLLGVVETDSDALKSLQFNNDWFEEDESMIIMFFAYVINSGQSEQRIPKLLIQSRKLMEQVPTLKSVHEAMRAYVI